ncbi:Phospholipid methyltransferase [Dillenia turbinata]|uniref:Protein-S-isoprenylcysteine O-methyltransferase n=1 Tax=Dillenia turbinata TaxID=194707 RepID=A0AAN8VGF6_9MAGN
MGSTSAMLYSKPPPFGFAFPNNGIIINRASLRHFNEHLKCQHWKSPSDVRVFSTASLQRSCPSPFTRSFRNPVYMRNLPCLQSKTQPHQIKCSLFGTTSTGSQNPFFKTPKNLSFESLKRSILELTPMDICKWAAVLSIVTAVTKWAINLAFNPFFWMYFSWTWLFWPWYIAFGLAFYGGYCFLKHLRGEANEFEQLAIVTSAFTWLTLVPPAFSNGFLEGWPYVFFFVYHYFFFFNVSVRKRLYGDLYPREHDPKWDVNPPNWYRILFGIGVMVGHWLAAFEGPELHLIPGGWNNLVIWVLIMITLFMQYNSTLYLAKYSEKIVVPTAVVQFGPYRWVRHPIYASTMLLFVTYCVALRAPLSSLFVVATCLLYYDQKAKLEEALMLENFREGYIEYMNKIKYKFIPFVY